MTLLVALLVLVSSCGASASSSVLCSEVFRSKPKFVVVADSSSRFQFPETVEPIIPKASVEALFNGLQEGVYFERVLRIPGPLSEVANGVRRVLVRVWYYGEDIIEIKLFNPDHVELISPAERELMEGLWGRSIKKVPVQLGNPELIEELFPSIRLHDILAKAAGHFDKTAINDRDRISEWFVLADLNNLQIDVKGWTKAELWTVLNELARDLEQRSAD